MSWCALASTIAALIVEDDNNVRSTHGGDAIDRKRGAMADAAVMSCSKGMAGLPAAVRA